MANPLLARILRWRMHLTQPRTAIMNGPKQFINNYFVELSRFHDFRSFEEYSFSAVSAVPTL
jgi:hypothetical protein